MILATCRNCMWFVVHTNPRPSEPSEYGCRQVNWAGYVIHPDQSECGGVAFVPQKALSGEEGAR